MPFFCVLLAYGSQKNKINAATRHIHVTALFIIISAHAEACADKV